MTGKRRPTAEEWRQISALFDELADLPEVEAAEALAASRADVFVEREARALLSASRPQGILDTRAPGPAMQGDVAPSLAEGTVVGVFKIERPIGRGGSGEVYLAHRADGAFEQRVALKLLRPDATAQTALFEAERQILSRLEHPGIARLIDGGATADGLVFTAMEYVDGTDIVSWCETYKATLATRLNLFGAVCEAVAYAHRQLVVHRDLKPSNLMVDSDGRVRLLDFGVAGLVGATRVERSLTPEYAAPEQFGEKAPTTLSDIYGLGATLFELLSGRRAWQFTATPLPVVLHRLLNSDVPPMSQVVAERATAPVPARQLTGDLDAIVAKAMHRDPAQRYQTVDELATDLQRHMARRPVTARPTPLSRRAALFMSRNPLTVAASALALVALTAGSVGILLQMRATAVERDIAREEAARAEAIHDAISLMFGDVGDTGKATTVTAKELLDINTAKLIETLDGSNHAHAPRVIAIAELYEAIDDMLSAEALLAKALEKNVGGDDPVMTAEIKLQLGAVKAAKGETDEARRLMAEAQPVWDASPERFRAQRLEAIAAEASVRSQTGDVSGCILLLLDSLPEAERVYAPNSREILVHYVNLSVHLFVAGRFDEFQAMLDRAERAAKAGGRERTSPGLLIITMRGVAAARRGDFEAMERYSRQSAELRRELFGPSAALANDLFSLGMAQLRNGKPAEALATLREALAMMEAHLGKQPSMLLIYAALVDALVALDRLDEAEDVLREVEPLMAQAEPLRRGTMLRARATLRLAQGRYEECLADAEAAEALFESLGAVGEPLLATTAAVREKAAKARAAATP